ncbi:MAG: hypothetical protein M0R51_13655 [Clostridia bacterium]|jgi:hypothetical protein|nr:hypothetical protein [Clostridia bacterium]
MCNCINFIFSDVKGFIKFIDNSGIMAIRYIKLTNDKSYLLKKIMVTKRTNRNNLLNKINNHYKELSSKYGMVYIEIQLTKQIERRLKCI